LRNAGKQWHYLLELSGNPNVCHLLLVILLNSEVICAVDSRVSQGLLDI